MDERDARLIAGAEAIAGDLRGPAGAIPLDRVIARHLPWFALCRERGMSWPQICRLLHTRGAGREGGLPFTHGHLSAVVWRQRQKRSASLPPASLPVAEPERVTPRRSGVSRTSDPSDRAATTPPRVPGRKPKPVHRDVAVEAWLGEDGLAGEVEGIATVDAGHDQPSLSGAEASRIRALMARAAGRRR